MVTNADHIKYLVHQDHAFASADIFTVTFKGRGGHGAMPHDCIDAAIVASSFVMNVQSVVSRTIDPQNPAVLTVGKMVVGTRFNVIAENAVIEGTVRCFDPKTRDHIEKQLKFMLKMLLVFMVQLLRLNISVELKRLLMMNTVLN